MHKVVKPFLYAGDGITVVKLIPGDERDFGTSTVGLLKEGFIEEAKGKKAAEEPVEANSTDVKIAEPVDPEAPPVSETDAEPIAAEKTKRGRPSKSE